MYPQERRRVKVYRMEGKEWVDRGVGFVSIDNVFDTPFIKVKSEESDALLLKVKIYQHEDLYARQKDSLIVWEQADEDQEPVHLALSFQEKHACSLVWNEIIEAQQKMKENAFLESVLTYPAEQTNLQKQQHHQSHMQMGNSHQQHLQQHMSSQQLSNSTQHISPHLQNQHLQHSIVQSNQYSQHSQIHQLNSPHQTQNAKKRLERELNEKDEEKKFPISKQFQDDKETMNISNVEKSFSDVSTLFKVAKTDVNDDFCCVCHGGGELILCDGCPNSWHLTCLHPPLNAVPEGSWFCPNCKNQRTGSISSSNAKLSQPLASHPLPVYRVTYNGKTIKADSHSLNSLKERILPCYPDLVNKSFQFQYMDDEDYPIDIIDEDCFTIFLTSNVVKDLTVLLD